MDRFLVLEALFAVQYAQQVDADVFQPRHRIALAVHLDAEQIGRRNRQGAAAGWLCSLFIEVDRIRFAIHLREPAQESLFDRRSDAFRRLSDAVFPRHRSPTPVHRR